METIDLFIQQHSVEKTANTKGQYGFHLDVNMDKDTVPMSNTEYEMLFQLMMQRSFLGTSEPMIHQENTLSESEEDDPTEEQGVSEMNTSENIDSLSHEEPSHIRSNETDMQDSEVPDATTLPRTLTPELRSLAKSRNMVGLRPSTRELRSLAESRNVVGRRPPTSLLPTSLLISKTKVTKKKRNPKRKQTSKHRKKTPLSSR